MKENLPIFSSIHIYIYVYVYTYCIYFCCNWNTVILQRCNVKQSIWKMLIPVGIILEYVISHQIAIRSGNDSFWGHTPSKRNPNRIFYVPKKPRKTQQPKTLRNISSPCYLSQFYFEIRDRNTQPKIYYPVTYGTICT